MANFAKNKILLFGIIAVMLVGIPLTTFVVRQQQENRSQAEKATKLSFLPESTVTNPIKKGVGETLSLDVNVTPGTNIVSFLKLEITYDESKLATAEADAFMVNDTAFPVTLEGPTYAPGKIAATLSVGSDPTKAIQDVTKAATINFKTLAETGGTPINVTYGNSTEILSIGSNDQASENVLLSVEPAVIIIEASTITPTIGDGTPVPTTPQPTVTLQPTSQPVPTNVPQPTDTGTGGPDNVAPACTALNLDRETTGPAPYAVTFTAIGNDTDGTISKVTFNYGDGPVETVTDSGGIGSNTISVQKSHSYTNPGTYTATAMLTDSSGAVSDQNTCRQTIIVLAPTTGSGNGGGGTGGGLSPFPTATIASPGPGDVMLGIGALGVMLTLIGGFLFFAL